MRLQFYPTAQLGACLATDAAKRNVSQSALVVSILEEYYNISPQLPPLIQLLEIIYDEVNEFVSTLEDTNYEFTLAEASATYRSIPVTTKGKGNSKRISIGKSFNKQTVSGRFKGIIKQVYLEDGTPKRTSNKNRAALFVKIEGEIE